MCLNREIESLQKSVTKPDEQCFHRNDMEMHIRCLSAADVSLLVCHDCTRGICSYIARMGRVMNTAQHI